MQLISIKENIEDNKEFEKNALCRESLYMTMDFFKKVGYTIPWISYYAKDNEVLVGAGAFKGAPQNGIVEIAYATFEPYQRTGVGTKFVSCLLQLRCILILQ